MPDTGKWEQSAERAFRRWRSDDPKRVVGHGHPVGGRWLFKILPRH